MLNAGADVMHTCHLQRNSSSTDLADKVTLGSPQVGHRPRYHRRATAHQIAADTAETPWPAQKQLLWVPEAFHCRHALQKTPLKGEDMLPPTETMQTQADTRFERQDLVTHTWRKAKEEANVINRGSRRECRCPIFMAVEETQVEHAMQINRQQRWRLICILQAGRDSAILPPMLPSGPAICDPGLRASLCDPTQGGWAVQQRSAGQPRHPVCYLPGVSHVRPNSGRCPNPRIGSAVCETQGGGAGTEGSGLPSATFGAGLSQQVVIS
ncbi:hypothetical protein MDA_GLEAN10021188 [Myotis davidii]|uniref:Uncharacterized protein n=1 Tax=Myotis davidii TaxID=225400 RepID=L5LY25_MYODS|nr:hypothetical protein MDA_GLEAN10021188 [Myotis davidii]